MGHTGLMPQSVSVLGGFGPQGRTADSALLVIQDAIVRAPREYPEKINIVEEVPRKEDMVE